MLNSPRWRDPPVQEVVFELFFRAVSDYSLFLSSVYSNLKDNYSRAEALPANEIPLALGVPSVIRHRFSTSSGDLLFQLGPDILTINSLSYVDFDNYLKDVTSVLNEVIKAGPEFNLSEATRIGLRYINRFDKVNDIFEILHVNAPFGSLEHDSLAVIRASESSRLDERRFLARSYEYADVSKELFFDLHLYEEFSPLLELELQSILDWILQAHDVVSDVFEDTVSDLVKRERK